MAICNVVRLIEPQQCIGDSLPIINDNFVNLNSSVCQLETQTTNLSSAFSAGITEYLNESSFVYSVNSSGTTGVIGTLDITNQWQNIYTSPQKNPLRITVPQASFKRKALITAKLYVRRIDSAFTTYWARIGRFTNATEILPDPTAPLDVLAVGCGEFGGTSSTEANAIHLEKCYNLEPNTVYHFGLQSYFIATSGPFGWYEVNGWQSWAVDNGPPFQGQTLELRNPDPTNYAYIYASRVLGTPWAPNPNGIGMDLPGPFETGDTSLRCSSYIKATII